MERNNAYFYHFKNLETSLIIKNGGANFGSLEMSSSSLVFDRC